MGIEQAENVERGLHKYNVEVNNVTVESDELWYIESGDSRAVKNIEVKGELRVDGTLYVFGTMSEEGSLTGDGTVSLVT